MNTSRHSSEKHLREAVKASGIPYNGPINFDGRLRRFKPEGDRMANGWYVAFPGTPTVAVFGCWKRGIHEKWPKQSFKHLSDAERRESHQRFEEAKRKQEEAEKRRREAARRLAQRIYSKAESVNEHPYLSARHC